MSTFIEQLGLLQRFLEKLTWTKIIQMTVLFFVMFSAWIVFQARNDIALGIKNYRFDKYATPLHQLSKKTSEELEKTVTQKDIVNSISVEVIDFRTNTKYVSYLFTNVKDLKDIYAKYDFQTSEQPLFTNNANQNKIIINLINGEFICTKYSTTANGISMPESKDYISTVCSNSIPPYYGKIVGIVSIYLKRDPTPEEVDQIRILTRNLSIMIYDKELK
jgi:hypothetical protein